MRYLLFVLGLLVIVGALAGVKFAQISTLVAFGEESERAGPPPEAVGSAIAKADRWELTLTAVGSLAGARTVAVANEAAGVVERIAFTSGKVVRKGTILVELDAEVERAQLAAAKTRRDLARVTARRSRELVEREAAPVADLDEDEAELRAAAAEVASLEAQVERKLVRAPFAGRLGVRAVDVGQYLAPGTTVTNLDSTEGVFVDFSLPQERLAAVAAGMPVRVAGRGAEAFTAQGAIFAIEPTVDDETRSVKIRAALREREAELSPGMFVTVSVVLPERMEVVAVPATAIVHASYGDSVFVLEPKTPGSPGADRAPDGRPVKIARQKFVRVGPARGDFVAITEGISAGQEVVTAGAFKLRNGSPVVVEPGRQPRPELAPTPENR
jgi:membrane fusion protein (multidrug efflux system)